MTAHRLILVGPPGAGKGTQAKFICQQLGIVQVSTGEIFRANISGETPLGQQAKRYIEAGEFVPDSVTNPMVANRLAQDDLANGYLLDGYPRTLAQAQELDRVLGQREQSIDLVLSIDVPLDEVVTRLLKRAQIEGRADDTEPVIRHRMEVYSQQTAPLIEHYRASGLLRAVDGTGSIEDVRARIRDVLR